MFMTANFKQPTGPGTESPYEPLCRPCLQTGKSMNVVLLQCELKIIHHYVR
jgi:hypothetical protein